jgi:uncharacterized protein (TIGR03083 family)
MPEPLELLETQAAATQGVLQSITDADFARDSSGCPGWTVKEVVAHLTTGAQMFEGIARGTLDGANWPEERKRRLAENAALNPDELRRRYTEADASLVNTFKSLSADELQAKRQHPALGEVPVIQFLGMRISETAIHSWDIQSAIDPTATLQAPASSAVAAQIVNVFPSWFVADSIGGLSRTYRFVVDDTERTLAIAGGKAAWTSGGSADATLTLDTGDFLLLMTGRLSSETLITSGRAQASGDVQAAKQLSTLFKAYAGR